MILQTFFFFGGGMLQSKVINWNHASSPPAAQQYINIKDKQYMQNDIKIHEFRLQEIRQQTATSLQRIQM